MSQCDNGPNSLVVWGASPEEVVWGLRLMSGPDPLDEKCEQRARMRLARQLVPTDRPSDFNQSLKELGAIMAGVGEAKKGMAINLDWTGAETQVLIQDQPVGKPIAGQDFYRALLRVWLGDKPVQDDLKKALLGG